MKWQDMTRKYPLPLLWQFPKLVQHPYLHINMTLFVEPECVQIEKGFVTGGTHQPHSQVPLAHMSANGSTWGWWTLSAALNPASIHLLDPPNWMQRGCILVGRVSSEAGRAAGKATFDACLGMSAMGMETLGPVDFWGGGCDMARFLGGRWGWRYGEVWHHPLRSL